MEYQLEVKEGDVTVATWHSEHPFPHFNIGDSIRLPGRQVTLDEIKHCVEERCPASNPNTTIVKHIMLLWVA